MRDAAKLRQKTLSGGICLAPSLQIVRVRQSQRMETPQRNERKELPNPPGPEFFAWTMPVNFMGVEQLLIGSDPGIWLILFAPIHDQRF